MGEASGIHVREVIDFNRAMILIRTGFDRDLSLAGRVMVRAKNGCIIQKLVRIDRPSRILTLIRAQLNRAG
jgi:aspartyl aminopeptidase